MLSPRIAHRDATAAELAACCKAGGTPHTRSDWPSYRRQRPMAHDHDHGNGQEHPSRRQIIGSATALGLAVPLSQLAWAATPEVAHDMARAAMAWLAQLDARQRADAQLPWSSRRREDWHYVPRARAGLALRQMSPAQMAAAWDMLGTLLSAHGRERVRELLRLEGILGEITRNPAFRDPGNYALVVFG